MGYLEDQLLMLDPTDWLGKHWKPAPRNLGVKYAMESEGLVGRWCARKYLQPLLSLYRATGATTCWENVYMEKGTFRWKDGTLRSTLLALGRPMDPDLGLIRVGGGARLSDVREVALNVQMSFGATGCSLDEFPLPGFRNLILVQLDDPKLAMDCWNWKSHSAKASTGAHYHYETSLHVDAQVGVNVVPDAVLKVKLERGPLPALAGKQLNHVYSSWKPRDSVLLLEEELEKLYHLGTQVCP